MDAGLGGEADGGLCRFEVAADPVVKCLREAFEVDVHGIEVWQEFAERRFAHLAVRHKDDGKVFFAEQFRTVKHVFIAHKRLVVGERNADVAVFLPRIFGKLHEGLGGKHLRAQAACFRAGNLVVLAKRTEQIAAIAANREDDAPWMEMIKRFLFDGVECEGRDLSIVLADDLPAAIRACRAEVGAAFRDAAVVRAEPADHAVGFSFGHEALPFQTCRTTSKR